MNNDTSEQRLITLAIHTYDRAVELKHTLEHQGIPVVLHNVNLTHPVISSGVRVRIREIDLPAALRIVENSETISNEGGVDSANPLILVPVDFAEYSLKVIDFAFRYADIYHADVMLLHSYINPALSKRVQLSDNISFELTETQETDKQLYADAFQRFEAITTLIRKKIDEGKLPRVKFTTRIQEGVPEDTIIDIAKQNNPYLIIMATRTSARKEQEMIGSVTAEVLDSSRYPVLSIPECIDYSNPDEINNIVYIANLDQADIIAIERLHLMFRDKSMNVKILPKPNKKEPDQRTTEQLDLLIKYCSTHHPDWQFSSIFLSSATDEKVYRQMIASSNINLIAVPSKKRNVFTRFFNPSVAHQLLLKADATVLTIPV